MQDFKQALQNALKQSMENKMQNQTTNAKPITLKELTDQWDADSQEFKKPTREVRTIVTPAPESQRGQNLVSNNVSRATFCYVRDNPHKTKTEITNALAAKGYNASSVATLVGQMVRGGQAVSDDEGRIFTMFKEYTPIKNGTALIRMQKKKKIKAVSNKSGRPPAKAGIAALDVQAAPALPKPTPAPAAPASFDVDALLSTLSFPQAVELFKKLRFMLGEASRGGL